VFSLLVLYSTRPLTIQMIRIIMHKNELTIRNKILEKFRRIKKEYVLNIHDLHVWELTPGNFVVSAHVVCKGEGESLSLISKKMTIACRELGIKYTTFQVESLENL
jgi:Co/Zn/Cd efflux system component